MQYSFGVVCILATSWLLSAQVIVSDDLNGCVDMLEDCSSLASKEFCNDDSFEGRIRSAKCALSCGHCSEVGKSRPKRSPKQRGTRPSRQQIQPYAGFSNIRERNALSESRAEAAARIRAGRAESAARIRAARAESAARIREARARARTASPPVENPPNMNLPNPHGSNPNAPNPNAPNQNVPNQNTPNQNTPNQNVPNVTPASPVNNPIGPNDSASLSIFDQTKTAMIQTRANMFKALQGVRATTHKMSDFSISIAQQQQAQWPPASFRQWTNEVQQISIDLKGLIEKLKKAKKHIKANIKNMQSQELHYNDRQNIARSIRAFGGNFVKELDGLEHLINAVIRFDGQVTHVSENVENHSEGDKFLKFKSLFDNSANPFTIFTQGLENVDSVQRNMLNEFESCLSLVGRQSGDLPNTCFTQTYSITINETELNVPDGVVPNQGG